MNVILTVGNVTAEYGTEGEGYAPDVADDLHRHAVTTMRDLLAVAVTAGAYRGESTVTVVRDDEDEGGE